MLPSFELPISLIGSDQNSKVRRGEDRKRCFQNRLTTGSSKQFHYTIDHHLHLICELTEAGLEKAKTWGQDQEATYRQLPARTTWDQLGASSHGQRMDTLATSGCTIRLLSGRMDL